MAAPPSRRTERVPPAAFGGAFLLSLAILLLALPTASAASEQTWNTTALFDRGDKSDPGAAFFAESGVDQPWIGYISHPSSFYDAATQRTYMVWQGDWGFTPHIIYYDHVAKAWSDPVVVTNDNPVRGDGHGAPVVIVSSTGKLHVMCCAHDTELQYYRSTNANDIRTWTHMPTPTVTGAYPNVFPYGSKMFLMYRDGPPGSGAHVVILNSTDDGVTWGTLTYLLELESYWGNFALRGNMLYFSWNAYNVTLHKRVNVYVCAMNLATRDVFSMDGTNLGWEITQDEADAHCLVRDTGGVNANQPYVDVFGGVPHVTWNEGDTKPERFMFSKRTGVSWSPANAITTTDSGTAYQALHVKSPVDLEAYLTTPGFDHVCSGDCEYSGDLERWTSADGGATWARSEVILSETHAGEPVNFPVIPMNARDDLLLTFAEWGKILPSGSTGVNAQTNLKLYAWGSDGFVRNSRIPSGAFGVDTSTDNPRTPANRFVLSNDLGDTFATSDANADTFKWHFAQAGDGKANCSASFTGSAARYAYTSAGSGDTRRKDCYAVATFGVAGDFDVQYKARTTIASGTRYAQLWMLDVYDVHSFVAGREPLVLGASDGLMVQVAPGGGIAFAYNVTGGDLTPLGNTYPTCTTCWVRIIRSGATLSSFVSGDGIAWALAGQVTKPLGGTMHALLAARFIGVTNTAAMEFDDVKVTRAASVVDGYRTEGRWLSPSFSVPFGQRVASISFTANGGNGGTVCVDRVELRQFGFVRESWSGCPTSPLKAHFVVQGPNVDVRITLKGDGTASPSVASVSVAVEDAMWGPPTTGWRGIGIVIIALPLVPFRRRDATSVDAEPRPAS